MTLREYIEQEIRERGPIPFSRYMELCLYGAPGGDPPGFYSRSQETFGKSGDFYTSSDVHAVFGRLLTRQFEEMWRVLGAPARVDVVELGPGRGLFAQDVLDWSEKKFPHFASALHYTLVETSPELARRLRERFLDRIAHGRVEIVPSGEQVGQREHAIVFANEFFDALPVEVVTERGQVYVDVENGRFFETFRPPGAAVHDFLNRYSVCPKGAEPHFDASHTGAKTGPRRGTPVNRVEACPLTVQWMNVIARVIKRGFAIINDYGYTREEQLAGRHLDTLMTYRKHSAGTNPYEAPGEQDITAHANFTALQESGREAGLHRVGLITQAQFLMGIGEDNQFGDAFEGCRSPQETAKVALQLKHIATPVGMGEVFDVLVFSKGVETDVAGGLSGQRFAR